MNLQILLLRCTLGFSLFIHLDGIPWHFSSSDLLSVLLRKSSMWTEQAHPGALAWERLTDTLCWVHLPFQPPPHWKVFFVLFCFFLGFFVCLFYFLESWGMQKHKCQFKGKANDWKHGVGFLCFCFFFFSSDYVIPSSALGALTMVGYQFWEWGGVLPCLFQIL